jgi:pimeloyl-ACP methyl ester carboxylesterase
MSTIRHLYVQTWGSGAPILLLHGHTLDHRIWSPVAEALAGSYRVICPDLPGHGRSGLAPDGAAYADDLARLLDDLGLDRVAVCGLSLGGAVAISLALHHPDRCQALIPVASAIFGQPFPTWPGLRPYVQLARERGLAAGLSAWLTDPLFATLDESARHTVTKIVQEFPGAGWTIPGPKAAPPGPPEADRLEELQLPTLVMVGERDLPDFKEIAQKLATAIPGARLHEFPGIGHLVPVEAPGPFVGALRSFLAEVM